MAEKKLKLVVTGDVQSAMRALDKLKGVSAKLDFDKAIDGKLANVRQKFDRFSSGMADRGRKLAKSMAIGIGVGLAALTTGAAFAFGEADEAYKVGKQTDQVIKTMGASSWTSSGQVSKLAEKLSGLSGVDDEVIQSGENLLLTFGKVRNEAGKGNDIFDRTTAVANDMSVALGQDMSASSIQLGKALNDPIKGITALSRVGVSFSKEQKETIKTMAESGDVLGAQKLILAEVEKQFGGTAEAIATPAEKLKVTIGNLGEKFGTFLIPKINAVAGFLMDVLPKAFDQASLMVKAFMMNAFGEDPDITSDGIFGFVERLGLIVRDLWPHIVAIGDAIAGVGRAIAEFFKSNPAVLFSALGAIIGFVVVAAVVALGAALVAAVSSFMLIAAAIGLVVGALVYAYTNWGWFKTGVDAVVSWFTNTAGPALAAFAGYVGEKFAQFAGWVREIWPQVQEAVGHALTFITVIIGAFVVAALALWNVFGSSIIAFAISAWNFVKTHIEIVINIIRGVIGFVLAIINGDWSLAWENIKLILSNAWAYIQNLVSLGIAFVKLILQLGWEGILATLRFLWELIKAAVGAAIDWVRTKIGEVINGIKGLWNEGWSWVKTKASEAWEGIKSTVGSAAEWVRSKVAEKFTQVKDAALGAIGGLRDGLGGIWEGIKNAFFAGVNKVRGPINTLIGGLNAIVKALPGNLPTFPTIPELQAGGTVAPVHSMAMTQPARARLMAAGGAIDPNVSGPFVTNGARAIVGEGRRAYPEYVIPTDPKFRERARGLFGQLGAKLMAAGGVVGGGPYGGWAIPEYIVRRESGGNYKAENPTSTASGAYQIVDGTWGGYKGYRHASDAPPSVQDERAAQLWAGGRGWSHWKLTAGPLAHTTGPGITPEQGAAALLKMERPDGGFIKNAAGLVTGIFGEIRKGMVKAAFAPIDAAFNASIGKLPDQFAFLRESARETKDKLKYWLAGVDDDQPEPSNMLGNAVGAAGRAVGGPGVPPWGLIEPFASKVAAVVAQSHGAVSVIAGRRSSAKQAELYRRYLAGTGNLAARPGTSMHEQGRAVDFGGSVSVWQRLARAQGLVASVPGENWHYTLPGYEGGAWRTKEGPAYLHDDEMVAPKSLANELRKMMSGQANGSSGSGGPAIGVLNVHEAPRSTPKDMARDIAWEVRKLS